MAKTASRLRDDAKSGGAAKFLICAAAVAIANLRPTYIGETQSFPVCSILVFLEALVLFEFYSSNERLSLNTVPALHVMLYTLVVTYMFVRSIFGGFLGDDDALKAIMISAAYIIAVILALSVDRYTRAFFDTFAIIIIASCVSVSITFLLVTAGAPISALIIAQLPDPPTYPAGFGQVAFPFTHVANEALSWFGAAPRLAGLMREPGCLPPFACWAATYAYLRKWPTYLSAICLLASLLCLSTIGPLALYTGAMLVLFKFKLKPIPAALIILGIAALAWPVIYTMDYIGLEQKINSGTGSYQDREWLFWAVVDTNDFIFGDGNRWSLVASGAGINLVSQIRVYGLVFFVPVIGIYLLALANLRLWLGACVPALIAVFFSQPTTLDPAFLMIFFSGAALAAHDRAVQSFDGRASPEQTLRVRLSPAFGPSEP